MWLEGKEWVFSTLPAYTLICMEKLGRQSDQCCSAKQIVHLIHLGNQLPSVMFLSEDTVGISTTGGAKRLGALYPPRALCPQGPVPRPAAWSALGQVWTLLNVYSIQLEERRGIVTARTHWVGLSRCCKWLKLHYQLHSSLSQHTGKS